MASSQGVGVGEFESRYAHLIKPIRDLTQNWNMDIAAELAMYMEEIGHIQISFDGGATTMNFAEAAMLIQGSAAIYSKKVEYLYTLVNQLLDQLASKKKLAQAGSVDEQGADSDATFTARRKQHNDDELLSLDNLKEARHLDLVEDEATPGGVTLLQRVPLALLPQPGDKGHHPLLSPKGEVVGNRKDFRLNTSHVHFDGTLLLDLSNLELLERSLLFKPHSTPFPTRTQGTQMEQEEEAPPPLNMEEDDGGASPLHNFSMPDVSEEPAGTPESAVLPGEMEEEVGRRLRQRSPARKAPVRMANLPETRREGNLLVVNEVHIVDDDDAVEEVEAVGRKHGFRQGRTGRQPPEIDTPHQPVGPRKRKHDEEVVGESSEEEEVYTPVYIVDYFGKHMGSKSVSAAVRRLRTKCVSKLAAAGLRETKRRQACDHNRRVQLAERGRMKELIGEAADVEGGDDHEGGGGAVLDDDGVGGERAGLPAGDPLLEEFPPHPLLGGGDDAGFDDEEDVNDYLRSIAGVHEEPAVAAGGDFQVLTSYEELVRQHVEVFLTSAQQYTQMSDIHRRVQDWQERIQPLLEKEEDREPFDIHMYGSTIIDNLQTCLTSDVSTESDDTAAKAARGAPGTVEGAERSKPVRFARIVKDKEVFQISRLFAATLQLANDYNVEIGSLLDQSEAPSNRRKGNNSKSSSRPSDDAALERAMDSMTLRLLSTARRHEALRQFHAPSVEARLTQA